MGDIEISYRDRFTMYGEGSVRVGDGDLPGGGALTWPDVCEQNREPLVARVDGVVAGRAFLETELYPFAELENVFVDPCMRGKGVGDVITADSVRRAAELGYLAIHLQTNLDNRTAQRLYLKHGFLPAQRGERLRMVRFLALPVLRDFLFTHPLVCFDSKASGDGLWLLEWRDFTSDDCLSITLTGGSCQGDSDGFAPGVAEVAYKRLDTVSTARVIGPDEVKIDEEFSLELSLTYGPDTPLAGMARLLLNPGCVSGDGTTGVVQLNVDPNSKGTVTFPLKLTTSFDTGFWKNAAYPSVPIGIQVIINRQSFWLVKQVKVR